MLQQQLRSRGRGRTQTPHPFAANSILELCCRLLLVCASVLTVHDVLTPFQTACKPYRDYTQELLLLSVMPLLKNAPIGPHSQQLSTLTCSDLVWKGWFTRQFACLLFWAMLLSADGQAKQSSKIQSVCFVVCVRNRSL